MKFRKKIKAKEYGKSIILFFILPILALYGSIRSFNERFIVFTGTVFMGIIGSLFFYRPGSDGYTHLMRAENNYDLSFIEFISYIPFWLTNQTVLEHSDLYLPIISYISVSIFGIPSLIHVFGGLVLGYFFTKSVLLIIKDTQARRWTILFILFLIFFLTIRSISALNSLRMWTAMWVLFYGSFAYFKHRKLKYFFVIAFSIFIHFTYYIFIIPVFATFFLINKPKLISTVYLISIFFTLPFINADALQKFIPEGTAFEHRASYTLVDPDQETEEFAQVETRERTSNFYRAYGSYIYRNYSSVMLALFLLLLLNIKGKAIQYFDHPNNYNNFKFLAITGILLFSIANIFDFGGFSGRSHGIGATFATASLLLLLAQARSRKLPPYYRNFIILFMISSVPFWLFHLSYILNTTSFFILALPFVNWFFVTEDISIRDFIAQILF